MKELDLENSRLRDLLKNTQYHKITRAEIEPIEIQFDDQQFCQSIHESLNKNKKNIEKKRTILVKQLEEDRSHKRKIQSYTQEAIQE